MYILSLVASSGDSKYGDDLLWGERNCFFSFDVVRDSLRLECQVVFDEGERLLTDLKG